MIQAIPIDPPTALQCFVLFVTKPSVFVFLFMWTMCTIVACSTRNQYPVRIAFWLTIIFLFFKILILK